MQDIFFVIGELGIGGTERHLSNVARALKRKGWGVSIYSLAGDGPMRQDLEAAGVKVLLPPVDRTAVANVLPVRALRLVLVGVHLTYMMLRVRPRIGHFFLPAAYLIGATAATLACVKVNIMSRRSLSFYQKAYPGVRRMEMIFHRRMNAILGNSRAVVHQLRDDEKVPLDKLGLIYNGIDMPAAGKTDRAKVRASLGIDDGTLVLTIVANLIGYKGHLDLIAALGIAHEKIGGPWQVLIVGRDDGPGADIEAAARELRIDGHVSMLGQRTDVADLLSASYIGLLCSHEEGFSNAILEGMAAGLPMVVTDVGGNAEAVLEGENGFVVPSRDPAALAEAIVRLAHDPALRARLGAAGRKRIEEHFSLDACIERYEDLYRGLFAGRLPRDILGVRV